MLSSPKKFSGLKVRPLWNMFSVLKKEKMILFVSTFSRYFLFSKVWRICLFETLRTSKLASWEWIKPHPKATLTLSHFFAILKKAFQSVLYFRPSSQRCPQRKNLIVLTSVFLLKTEPKKRKRIRLTLAGFGPHLNFPFEVVVAFSKGKWEFYISARSFWPAGKGDTSSS